LTSPGGGGALGLLRPAWTAPPTVGAAMSTRLGGASTGPWATLNLGAACGDDPAAVTENRRRFAAALPPDGAPAPAPIWLRQVHGTRVLHLHGEPAAAQALADAEPADAAWTDTPGLACTVGVADCLPVLLATADGRGVAAAHAGWRGLAGGVLQATVRALCAGSGCPPAGLHAWLGPCIGADAFEVGPEVLQAFGVAAVNLPVRHDGGRPVAAGADGPHFRFSPRADGSLRWRADLHGLARAALRAAGVQHVTADARCTVGGASDFFSFRRDGVTGRMAVATWRRR
jgi:YfiH family protein